MWIVWKEGESDTGSSVRAPGEKIKRALNHLMSHCHISADSGSEERSVTDQWGLQCCLVLHRVKDVFAAFTPKQASVSPQLRIRELPGTSGSGSSQI